jgi:signal transduction histidine kinase
MSVRLSVRVRILATLLLLTGLGMLVAGSTAYLVQRERVLSQVDDRLLGLAADAGTVATETSGATVSEVLTAIVQRVRPGANESSLGIIDGVAALSPGGSVDFRLDGDPGLVRRVVAETADGAVVRGTLNTPDGRTLRYVATPVQVSGDDRAGVFVAAVDLRAELAPLTDAFAGYALIAAGAWVLIAVVGWFVAGRLLRPIRSLTTAANRITASDLSERIQVVGNDDISQLTVTVNGMLDRLDGALTAQRQLLDDVGHELKTPLTIVRGHLELVDVHDPADVAASRDLAIDELDRMSGLVTDIAQLADTGRAGAIARRSGDVAALTDRIEAKATAIAERDWVVAARAEGTTELDPDRITQAMLQLAANAATHAGGADAAAERGPARGAAPASARIEIGTAWEDVAHERLRLWVRDFGSGIPHDAQERIFERFQRGRSDRTRGASGSGLGLAIVASIAAAHGGHVSVESEPGQGATFSIVIPAGRSGPPDAATAAGPHRSSIGAV